MWVLQWFSLSMTWRHIREEDVQHHPFWTSALDGDEQLTSRSGLLTPRKELRYPLMRMLSRPQSWSGSFREQKKTIAPAKNRNDERPTDSLVPTLSTLPRFLCVLQKQEKSHTPAKNWTHTPWLSSLQANHYKSQWYRLNLVLGLGWVLQTRNISNTCN